MLHPFYPFVKYRVIGQDDLWIRIQPVWHTGYWQNEIMRDGYLSLSY